MSPSTPTRDTSTLSGLLIALTILGIALLVANIPSSPFRSSNLELFAIFVLPLLISLVAFARFAASIVWWEISLMAVWGVVSIIVTAFLGFLATMGTAGSYPGPVVELLHNIALFLAVTCGLGIPYAFAGKLRHDHPRLTLVTTLLAGVVLFVLFNAVAVAT